MPRSGTGWTYDGFVPVISFPCETCGTRCVQAAEDEALSPLVLACSIPCALSALRAWHANLRLAQKTGNMQGFAAAMVQAEMRPRQWLALAETECRLEIGRLASIEPEARLRALALQLGERVPWEARAG